MATPMVGDHFIIKSSFIDFNPTIADKWPDIIKVGHEFEVLSLSSDGSDGSYWGIQSAKHVLTGQIVSSDDLEDYWSLFIEDDDIKFIPNS